MVKVIFSSLVGLFLGASANAATSLPRGSEFFSACSYVSPTGGTAAYEVDKTVGVLNIIEVLGCPNALTYEFTGISSVIVYQLELATADTCRYSQRIVGTVDCTKLVK